MEDYTSKFIPAEKNAPKPDTEPATADAELEARSLIPVDIEEVEDTDPDSEYVVLGMFSREGEMVPFTCMVLREELANVQNSDRIPVLVVTAFPNGELRRYSSEEEYENSRDEKEPFVPASQSILYREREYLEHRALVTGVVRGIRGEFPTMTGEKTAIFLEILGKVITLVLDEEEYEDLKPGEVLSGILSLFGDFA